jgi:hypothetical protein
LKLKQQNNPSEENVHFINYPDSNTSLAQPSTWGDIKFETRTLTPLQPPKEKSLPELIIYEPKTDGLKAIITWKAISQLGEITNIHIAWGDGTFPFSHQYEKPPLTWRKREDITARHADNETKRTILNAKWAGSDSNQRPPPCQGGILTKLDHRPLV